MNDRVIKPEDYAEPRCVLCGEPFGAEPKVKSVPQMRIIRKMDEYMARRDYEGAERHLLYWLNEAELGGDLRGQLLLRNELAGHYRKLMDREKALYNVEQALLLLKELDFEDSISAGTTYVNAATVMNAFGDNERSYALFKKAKTIYENAPAASGSLLGGLYNNMALTLSALERFDEAAAYFEKALAIMQKVPGGRLEQAITYLNLADMYGKMKGAENAEADICACLDKAETLLSENDGADEGYYAFVLEKCAPSFAYYGYFMTAKELKRKAEEIYERT
ncbi:MAG: tetratricopeptide repeat protein [Lachnospiraceae bacterium]|nr:tetratricopeptide repeat protein [Lachnospiraceae bacterium]